MNEADLEVAGEVDWMGFDQAGGLHSVCERDLDMLGWGPAGRDNPTVLECLSLRFVDERTTPCSGREIDDVDGRDKRSLSGATTRIRQ